MSFAIDPTPPAERTALPNGGMELQGMEDAENQLEGTENDDIITGGGLDDILRGVGGNNTISGGGGSDRLLGGDGDDELSGGDGNDIINATRGANIITGGSGDDRLIVESGGSTLTGGAGSDIFQLNFSELRGGENPSSLDELGLAITEITDFEPGEDTIRIEGLGGTEAPIYNQDTGILSLDDVEIAQLSTELNINPDDIEIADNDNPLSVVNNSEATVYRFLNPDVGVHFYTSDEGERQNVEDNLPFYNDEGESYKSVDPTTGAQEVYRFFNPATGVHLYTTSRIERDNIIDNLDNFDFEGVQFYAYENQVEGSIPVYRFLNPSLGVHFYTPSESEKNLVQETLPNYEFEGIAYYALPVDGS